MTHMMDHKVDGDFCNIILGIERKFNFRLFFLPQLYNSLSFHVFRDPVKQLHLLPNWGWYHF